MVTTEEVDSMTITELLAHEHEADLRREAAAYRRTDRVTSRADRTQPRHSARRTFLSVVRHRPVNAIGCEA